MNLTRRPLRNQGTPLLLALATALSLSGLTAHAAKAPPAQGKTVNPADVLKAAAPNDWREPAPESTVLMELPQGTVIIEFADAFAPGHVANIRKMVRAGYFDGLAIIRVQDNYVTQWGDAEEDDAKAKAKPKDLVKPPVEFDRPIKGLAITPLKENSGWAPKEGFAQGWPVGYDEKKGRAWLTHCYGMVGAGRGNEPDSSDGSSLYTVIGHAPRALDLNITSVGRVLQGMEALTALPRGTGTLGFYEKAEERLPIKRVRLLADVPAAERPQLQILRTDTGTWSAWLDARRNRSGWFVHNPGRTELCSVLPPVRSKP